jgi:large subunit ribosomal protein L10
MNKQERDQLIDSLTTQLNDADIFYLTDTEGLNAAKTSSLRRLCFRREVNLQVVKNKLLLKAMERSEKNFEELYPVLAGPTSLMFAEAANLPAKLIKEFRKQSNQTKPLLKAAYVEETCYIGEDQLENLINIKSRLELIGDIVGLLQSPAKNIISALQSGGGQKIHGILQTLSEKEA